MQTRHCQMNNSVARLLFFLSSKQLPVFLRWQPPCFSNFPPERFELRINVPVVWWGIKQEKCWGCPTTLSGGKLVKYEEPVVLLFLLLGSLSGLSSLITRFPANQRQAMSLPKVRGGHIDRTIRSHLPQTSEGVGTLSPRFLLFFDMCFILVGPVFLDGWFRCMGLQATVV